MNIIQIIKEDLDSYVNIFEDEDKKIQIGGVVASIHKCINTGKEITVVDGGGTEVILVM